MTQKERMLANLPYRAGGAELAADRLACRKKTYAYNHLPPGDPEEADRLLRSILGRAGDHILMEPPFQCDYGYNISIGDHFFSNFNLIILDVGHVRIGDNVQIAPNVGIYTAGHPLHPDSRNSGYEYGIDITIGDNVWIGAHCVILPGVTVGSNVVLGAGSVVTKDLPDNVLAAGNPCRVIRSVTEEDRDFYFRERKFDVEDF